MLNALPQGVLPEAGSIEIQTAPHAMVIAASDQAIIQYDSFQIGADESVQFLQPSKNSCILNRIRGSDPSSILGRLEANGTVFFVNPNGVYFGPNAQVNVGSLVVSILDIADQDFLNENYRFTLDQDARHSSISNEGKIFASNGSIALMAPVVKNTGTIVAQMGNVVIAAAEKMTLDFSGDGLITFSVDGELQDALIENAGQIETTAGKVLLSTSTARQAIDEMLNMEGVDIAVQLVEENGVIRLTAASCIRAQEIQMSGQDLFIEGGLQAQNDLSINADRLLCVRDRSDAPLSLASGGSMTLSADQIDILALANEQTRIVSGGDLIMISPREISADGHFLSGNFTLLKPNGDFGDFRSLYDPIISVTGNASFGAYTGVALKVEATGTITATGAIAITGPDATVPGGDSDAVALQTSSALILRAGLAALQGFGTAVPPNFSIGGTTFTSTGAASGSTISLGGGITTNTPSGPIILEGNVILTAPVTMTTGGGNVTVTGTVNGAFAFNLSYGAGAVSIGDVIGGSSPLASLTINGSGNITLSGISSGVTGATVVQSLAGSITLNGNSYQTTGAQTYTAGGAGQTITVNPNVNFLTTNAAVSLNNGTLTATAGAGTILISTGTGAITIPAFTNSLVNLTLQNSGVGTVTANGALTVNTLTFNIPTSVTLNSNLTTNTSITFPSAVTLNNSMILSNGTFISFNGITTMGLGDININSGGGAISFGNAVNGAAGNTSVIINAGAGTAGFSGTIGAAAGTTLALLTVNAGTINIASIGVGAGTGVTGAIYLTASEAINFTGTNYRSSAGRMEFTAAAGTTWGAGIGFHITNTTAVTFAAAAQVSFNNGTIFIDNGAVGTTTLTMTAGSFLTLGDLFRGASTVGITTLSLACGAGGGLSFGRLGVSSSDFINLTLISAAGGGVTTSNDIFGGTITLTIPAGANITLGGNITATNTISGLLGAVVLRAPNVIITSGVGPIAFGGTINADSTANTRNLTVNAAGLITFTGIVGGLQPFDSITAVSSASGITQTGVITTKTAINFTAATVITSTGSMTTLQPGNGITLNGNVTGSGTTRTYDTSAGGGDIIINGTIDAGAIWIMNAGSGIVSVAGAIGAGTAISTLTVTGSSITLNGIGTGVLAGATTVAVGNLTTTSMTLGGSNYRAAQMTFFAAPNAFIQLTGAGAVTFLVNVATSALLFPATATMTLSAATSILFSAAVTSGGDITIGHLMNGTALPIPVTITTGTTARTITIGGLGTDLNQFSTLTLGGTISNFVTAGDIYLNSIGFGTAAAITLGGGIYTNDSLINFTVPVTQTTGTTITISSSGTAAVRGVTFTNTLLSGGAGTTNMTINGGVGNVSFANSVGSVGVPFGTFTALTATPGTILQGATSPIFATGAINLTATGSTIESRADMTSSQSGGISLTANTLLRSTTTAVTYTAAGGVFAINGTVTSDATPRNLTINAAGAAVSITGTIGVGDPIGPIAITGNAITLSGNTITSNGAQTYTAAAGQAITFNAGALTTLTSTNNAIAFNGGTLTLSSNDLTINAGSSTISLGPVNGDARTLTLTTTTATSPSIVFGGSASVGTLTFVGPPTGQINIANNIITTTAAAALTFPAAVLFTGPSTISTANGDITFNGTLGGAQAVQVNSGSGKVNFTQIVGSTPLASLTVTSTDASAVAPFAVTQSGTITTNGPVTINVLTGTFQSGAAINTSGGAITINGNLVTAAASNTWNATSGAIAVKGTINGDVAGRNLTLITSGTVAMDGAIGATNSLLNLTVSGSTITQSSPANLTGTLLYTGAISLGGSITTTLAAGTGISLQGAVQLIGTPIFLTTSNAAVLFASTIDADLASNPRNLTINAGTGTLTFPGDVGGAQALTSLTATAGTTINLAGNLTVSSGGMTFTGPVALTTAGPSVTLTTSGGGGVNFSDATTTINGNKTLNIAGDNGAVAFNGLIGGGAALTALNVTSSATTTFAIASVIADSQSYTAASQFNFPPASGATTTFTGSGAGGISFTTGTLRSTFVGSKNLSFITGSGTISVSAIGAVVNEFGTISFTTTGPIITTGPILANTIVFPGASSIDLGGDLILNAPITFSIPVTISGANVTVSTGNNPIIVNSTINGTIIGANSLTLQGGTGSVTLSSPIGSLIPLGAFTAATAAPGILTQSAGVDITAAGLITLTATGSNFSSGANITSTGGGIAITGIIDRSSATTTWSAAGGVSVTGTIDSATNQNLTITSGGNIAITGNVGSGNALSLISLSGNSITLGGASWISNGVSGQTYIAAAGQPITFNAGVPVTVNSTNNPIVFQTGTITLSGSTDLNLNAGTSTIAIGPVSGAGRALTLTSTSAANPAIALNGAATIGTLTFAGPPTGSFQLGGSVTTTTAAAQITFPTPVTLTGNSTLTTSNGNVSFNSTIDGASSLAIAAGSGDVLFNGIVGGGTPLAGLSVASCHNTTFAITAVSANTQSYTASSQFVFPPASGAMTTFTGAGSGNIEFHTGTMRSTIAGAKNISLTTGSGLISVCAMGAAAGEFDTLFIHTVGPFATTGNIILDPLIFTAIPSSITFGGTITFTGSGPNTFTAQGNISNAAGPVLIQSNGNLTFNSLHGNVGSLSSPIFIQTPGLVYAGANALADFMGATGDGTIHIVPSNPPRLLIFNGVVLRDANVPFPPISLSPILFYTYVVGLYSTTDSLANDSYYKLDFYRASLLQPAANPIELRWSSP